MPSDLRPGWTEMSRLYNCSGQIDGRAARLCRRQARPAKGTEPLALDQARQCRATAARRSSADLSIDAATRKASRPGADLPLIGRHERRCGDAPRRLNWLLYDHDLGDLERRLQDQGRPPDFTFAGGWSAAESPDFVRAHVATIHAALHRIGRADAINSGPDGISRPPLQSARRFRAAATSSGRLERRRRVVAPSGDLGIHLRNERFRPKVAPSGGAAAGTLLHHLDARRPGPAVALCRRVTGRWK